MCSAIPTQEAPAAPPSLRKPGETASHDDRRAVARRQPEECWRDEARSGSRKKRRVPARIPARRATPTPATAHHRCRARRRSTPAQASRPPRSPPAPTSRTERRASRNSCKLEGASPAPSSAIHCNERQHMTAPLKPRAICRACVQRHPLEGETPDPWQRLQKQVTARR